MLLLSILLPLQHTHAAQPSHCRLSDRQNSEGQQVNNETLVRKKLGWDPVLCCNRVAVELHSVQCPVSGSLLCWWDC